MKYCPNRECTMKSWQINENHYCKECGTELTPEIACLCGQESFSPYTLPKFCRKCGTAITEEYLGRCMKVQLAQMVNTIAKGKNLSSLN